MNATKKRRKTRYNFGEACHDCGEPLDKIEGVSNSYLACKNRHIAARRQLCDIDSCRKIARQTGWSRNTGTWAACDDHVYRVTNGKWR